MSLCIALGSWVFSINFQRVTDDEEELPPLDSDLTLAFGFQPDEVDEED